MATGFSMTRISTTAAFLICLAFSTSAAAQAPSSNRSVATDNGCFPWQDFKNGQCIAKPAQAAPPALPEPAPEPAVAPPPPAVAAPQPPVAPAPPAADSVTRAPQITIVCDGGTRTDGTCACPAGSNLMPAAGNAGGGTCVRTNAENCLGGELTVSGKCMCSGQVTMDGQTYLLEYSNGKCLPARCPVTAPLRDGRCVAGTSPQLSSQPETKPVKETKDTADDSEPRRRCERGMVYTRSGCVPARRRAQDYESRLRQYYRNYRYPGMMGPD
jgi:hypothetical protein